MFWTNLAKDLKLHKDFTDNTVSFNTVSSPVILTHVYSIFVCFMYTYAFQSQPISAYNKKYKEKKVMISCKNREEEVGIKGK